MKEKERDAISMLGTALGLVGFYAILKPDYPILSLIMLIFANFLGLIILLVLFKK